MRRRVGSTASTAIRISGKRCTNRESSSSETVLLPAPPVPVIPTTGTPAPAACHCSRSDPSSSSSITSSSRADSICATDNASSLDTAAGMPDGLLARSVRSTRSAIMPSRPSAMPSCGW